MDVIYKDNGNIISRCVHCNVKILFENYQEYQIYINNIIPSSNLNLDKNNNEYDNKTTSIQKSLYKSHIIPPQPEGIIKHELDNSLIVIIKGLVDKISSLECKVNNLNEMVSLSTINNTSSGVNILNRPIINKNYIITLLNNSKINTPSHNIIAFIDSIKICNDTINKYHTLSYLFNNTIGNTILWVIKYNIANYSHLYHDVNNNIISNSNSSKLDICPIYYNDNTNTIYIYNYASDGINNEWKKISKDIVIKLMEKINELLFTQITEWEINNRTKILKTSSLLHNYLSSIKKITKFKIINFVKNMNLICVFSKKGDNIL
jgi:hypothetical protein